MTNSTDRLDLMENDLETIKDILLTVTRRAESTDQRLDRMVVGIETLSATVNQLATEAREDRVVMHEVIDQLVSLRQDNQRILDYLFGQQRGNGHGDQPEQ